MNWTQEEYDNLKKAYMDLMLGKRVVESDIGTGRSRVFQRGDVENMRALLSEMEASLGIENTNADKICLRTYAKQGGRAS
jgi:hypothetical protein